MKKNVQLVMIAAIVALLFTGCAGVRAPLYGLVYTETKAPEFHLAINTPSTTGSKVGKAMCTSVLGLIATGDCSLDAAMKSGGITKVQHVDYHSKSILGLYCEFTTVVYGE